MLHHCRRIRQRNGGGGRGFKTGRGKHETGGMGNVTITRATIGRSATMKCVAKNLVGQKTVRDEKIASSHACKSILIDTDLSPQKAKKRKILNVL